MINQAESRSHYVTSRWSLWHYLIFWRPKSSKM